MEPEVTGKLPVPDSTLELLKRSLRAVVTSGTARGVFSGLQAEVSGKTGTGQVFGRNLDGSAKMILLGSLPMLPLKNLNTLL